MKNPNEPAHKTRDHRFAYISTGDITRWARGTSKFVYPEPKTKKTGPVMITSKAACSLKMVAKAKAQAPCCFVAPSTHEKTVREEMAACDKRADAVDAGLAISNLLNLRLVKA